MGKVNKSIEYLEKYLKEVSNKEVDYQYSRACSCLAGIYNSMVGFIKIGTSFILLK
jgi:hypothetical protein